VNKFRITTKNDLLNTIASCSREAPHIVPMLTASYHDQMSLACVERGIAAPLRVLDRARKPAAVVIGDDHADGFDVGPTGFSGLPRLLRWARFVVVNATGPVRQHYQEFVAMTLEHRKFLLIETGTSRSDAWAELCLVTQVPTLYQSSVTRTHRDCIICGALGPMGRGRDLYGFRSMSSGISSQTCRWRRTPGNVQSREATLNGITLSSNGKLVADEQELRTFVGCLFRYADAGTLVGLRSFTHDKDDQVARIQGWPRVEGDNDALIASAVKAATQSANDRIGLVFAPPVVTFWPAQLADDRQRARLADLANGLCISVELDEGDIDAARRKLEHLLGPATVVVASGGVWVDPETGELHNKLHLHWRLSEPTRTPDEHAKLKEARNSAALLVGADMTAVPLARIIHRTARNRPRPTNTWARDFIAKNFIKQPIRIVVNDINGLALTAHFS